MTLCPGLTEVCNWPACPENGGRSVIGVVVRGDMTGLASSRLCRIGVVWPEGTVAGVVIAATALVMGTAATEIEPTGAAAGVALFVNTTLASEATHLGRTLLSELLLWESLLESQMLAALTARWMPLAAKQALHKAWKALMVSLQGRPIVRTGTAQILLRKNTSELKG
eukprot:CAMPEP_0197628068 /NCGR_PEP_ID=MMETSP1338-20131121/6490_1 /TAXON_ID=43686 ORGANISM="Pelagodinium beii, Strain RCC1491" /NCGR_SAMPLE_ID=MMETSP1338 /ASSEMBLY_ACC=CAM_ASM_000754 /LENGTH=167 /DNA_ID=CAMNT_0043198955 /DNA_START=965 /DNA_END=1469 /DNA_ORIENTATION=+